MLNRSIIVFALLLSAAGALCQAPDPAPDSIRVVSEKKADGADLIEWVYTLDCRAGGAAPSLRVTLGNVGTSASAGVTMAVGADDRATGILTVRVQAKDKEAGACLVTVEASSTESAMAGQTVRLPQGQNLPSLANLKPLPADTQVRRAIVVGSVGGCTITAYIMPGRTTARSPLTATPPPPGDPAVQAADVFRAWARGVKNGELEPFSAVVSPSEWNGMDAAQRTRRLQEYQESFKTVLGEGYNPDEFKIEYTASASVGSGKLKVRYGDKELPELRIHYLGGRWVLSEP